MHLAIIAPFPVTSKIAKPPSAFVSSLISQPTSLLPLGEKAKLTTPLSKGVLKLILKLFGSLISQMKILGLGPISPVATVVPLAGLISIAVISS